MDAGQVEKEEQPREKQEGGRKEGSILSEGAGTRSTQGRNPGSDLVILA